MCIMNPSWKRSHRSCPHATAEGFPSLRSILEPDGGFPRFFEHGRHRQGRMKRCQSMVQARVYKVHTSPHGCSVTADRPWREKGCVYPEQR